MNRFKDYSSYLDVYLYDEPIGKIFSLKNNFNNTIFQFNDDYFNHSNYPLSISFKNKKNSDIKSYNVRLQPFFSNLLPEGYLLKLLSKKFGINPLHEYQLLSKIENDLYGAVEIKDNFNINEHNKYKYFYNDEYLKILDFYKFSLTGVQLKFSIFNNWNDNNKNEKINSLKLNNSILKFPSFEYYRIPENEYSMLFISDKLNIETPKTKLISFSDFNQKELIEDHAYQFERFLKNNEKLLIVERFDRKIIENKNGNLEVQKIHAEDFAQILNCYPERKYNAGNISTIMSFLNNIENQLEFIKRLTFNVLIGNGDMHLKNWSILYYDKYNYKLAPVYDYVSTIAYIKDENFSLNIYKNKKKFEDFNFENLQRLSLKHNINFNHIKQIIFETYDNFQYIWNKYSSSLPMDERVFNSIEKHYKNIINENFSMKNKKNRKILKV